MRLSERYDAALAYASELHRDQTRKGTGVPYLTHLLSVSALVGEHGGDEDQMIAGLLHDAIEDQGATGPDLEARFGPRVRHIVEACTDAFERPKPAWRARKERYVAKLPGASVDVKLVSASDKLHNARSILADLRRPDVGAAIWSRFSVPREETLWYYRALVGAFASGWSSPVVDELDRVVAALEGEGRA